jgi:hypothetical protein
MTPTETKLGPGKMRRPGPVEVKSAMSGFLSEFKEFQGDVNQAPKQEERIAMLDARP